MDDSNAPDPGSSIEHLASSTQITAEDVLEAVDRETLARHVLKLLKQELRIQRDRLGHRGR
jgi:hypothetical protein